MANPSVQIIFDGGDFVVINKPALLDSQNSKESRSSVVDWLVEKFGFAGLVHRLDFGTSGVMVCAKNEKSARRLTDAIQSDSVKKTYVAIAFGRFSAKNLSSSGTISESLDEKEAITHYRVLEEFPNATLVELTIETGRKHQIRRHLSFLSCPIIGDTLYGKKGSDKLFTRPALHSSSLTIEGKEYHAPIPADMQALIDRWKTKK